MGTARLLMRMAYICSNCERALKLMVGDKIPKSCPHCNAEFIRSTEHGRVVNDSEESLTWQTHSNTDSKVG
jgi:DNA-directed RNA polymerase subunit RPC12/RpoP